MRKIDIKKNRGESSLVLIVTIVVIITLVGIVIVALSNYNENKGGSDIVTELSDTEKKLFNKKFEKYAGEQKGTSVKALINEVETTNTINPSRKIDIDVDILDIDSAAMYDVECKYDADGYVNKVVIK